MDSVFIRDLRVETVVGIYDWERRIRQTVSLDLDMGADIRTAAKSDRIEDTVDYRALKKRILAMAEPSSFHLEEALAHAVAALCLEYPQVQRVDVRVEKPNALRFARTVAVEISRGR